MTNDRMQYSLRTLLLATTVFALMLAYVPGFTVVCLSTAAVLTFDPGSSRGQ